MQTAIGVAMPAQDIGNLDGGPVRADVGAGHNPHPGRESSRWRHLQRQAVERALRRPDRVGGDIWLRVGLIVAASLLVALTFRLDRGAPNNLFPPRAISLSAPIGLALWILTLHGMTQTSVSLFMPLLLQVVHGVSPVWINVLNIVISCGWTIATFSVSGWSGLRERIALASGPVIALSGPGGD